MSNLDWLLIFLDIWVNFYVIAIFYPILLVGMNIFCTFAKVMTVTVITNTILRYEVLR